MNTLSKTQLKLVLEPLYLIKANKALIGQVIHEFAGWCQHNGLEWAKARIKALKVDYIRYMNGQPPVSGVRRKRNTQLPYGVFSRLWKLSNHRVVLDILNLYTRFPKKPEETDILTAEKAIAYNPVRSISDDTSHMDRVCQLARAMYRPHRLKDFTPFLSMEHSSSSPCISPLIDTYLYVPSEKGFAQIYRRFTGKRNKGLHNLEDDIMMWKLNKRLIMKDIPEESMKMLELGLAKAAVRGDFGLKDQYYSGEVNFVPDKGKLRHVAAPYRFNQHLTRPLGDFIYNFLKSECPWDCTFDQQKPISFIKTWLGMSQKVWCFDLKKATDSIPLKFQINVLKELLDPRDHFHISIFEMISKGVWSWKESPGRYVRWVTGQPLGLYPSFGSFALFHGLLLRSLDFQCNDPGILRPKQRFYIIGDDVIIFTKDLADEYYNACLDLRIPISESKTLTNGTIGEFAGKIISADEVYEPVNWSFHPDNVIDIGYRLGKNILRYLNPESRELLTLVGDLPYPYGCNWFSPIPYEKKVFIIEELKSQNSPDGDNPELQLNRILSEVTENLLNHSGISELQSNCCDAMDRRVGFAYSRLCRESCEKLFGVGHKQNPISMKMRQSFNQLGWLRLHLSQLQTLRSAHKKELSIMTGSIKPKR